MAGQSSGQSDGSGLSEIDVEMERAKAEYTVSEKRAKSAARALGGITSTVRDTVSQKWVSESIRDFEECVAKHGATVLSWTIRLNAGKTESIIRGGKDATERESLDTYCIDFIQPKEYRYVIQFRFPAIIVVEGKSLRSMCETAREWFALATKKKLVTNITLTVIRISLKTKTDNIYDIDARENIDEATHISREPVVFKDGERVNRTVTMTVTHRNGAALRSEGLDPAELLLWEEVGADIGSLGFTYKHCHEEGELGLKFGAKSQCEEVKASVEARRRAKESGRLAEVSRSDGSSGA